MSDQEDKTAEQLATEINSPQSEQADPADDGSQSSVDAPTTNDELILGKFKDTDALASAYQELERNYTASRQAPRTPAPKPVVPSQSDSVFDNDTLVGIRSVARAELEAAKVEAFARNHKDELADPLLRGAVLIEIQEANARGEYIDQEVALGNAKRALDARLTPKVEKASKESFEEGKNLTRRKEQAGAIGGTSTAKSDVNPDELSAEDYAAYYGIPHA